MLDLGLFLFVIAFLVVGLRRPFIWVLAYCYIDIVAPQKIGWTLTPMLPISLIAFVAAFAGWLLTDDKRLSRVTFGQLLLAILLVYCGITTLSADFPDAALEKWAWVWKALVFAIFLPLTLTRRLRIEAVVTVMTLSAAAIVITGAIKTLLSGGGYGELAFFVQDNVGLYEGSIISCVAIAIIPLIWWLARYSTIFPEVILRKWFAAALIFACLLIPIGTAARTGLICIGLLAALLLRSAKHKFLYGALAGGAALIAIPFLPASYTERMSTISRPDSDQSASTRMAVWKWTVDYVGQHPLGGGFDAYRGNSFSYETKIEDVSGASVAIETEQVTDHARAYHSSYFEMLGEQGWPGLLLWLTIHALGLVQMELVKRRWRTRAAAAQDDGTIQWQAPLATALQQGQLIYLAGSLFVGIAYQPFVLMLLGLQCGLASYCRRIDSPVGARRHRRGSQAARNAVTAGEPALP